MNITEAKFNYKKTSTLYTNTRGFKPYKSQAEDIYDKEKAAQKKQVHNEILRASMQQSLV